jgi:hypothetical protein
MRRLLPLFLLAAALGIYFPLCQGVWESRARSRAETPAGYLFPSKFSRILALGHQGLLSDFLFLKTATYIGGKGNSAQSMGEADWQFVFNSLDVVTDLDPYFVDPYMLAEGLLAWDAGKPLLANQLLLKGTNYRKVDWRLPFFIGFNHFYFLKDYETAAGYIMTAAHLPGSDAYLKTLGARLAYYGGKSKTALLFLQQMLAETDDPLLKNRLAQRLTALEGAVVIEEALEKFKVQRGRMPVSLSELVAAGFLAELPVEPYGGKWGVLENGRVFSTSRFAEAAPVSPPKE